MTSVAAASKNVIYGLYCLCHPEDGIRYVGQTSTGAGTRLGAHISMVKYREEHGLALSHSQRWIAKHRPDNIAVSILEVCLDKDDLNDAEPRWIAAFDNLTNIESGGKSASGHRRSEEARDKIRGEGNPMFGKDRRAIMAHARSFQAAASAETRMKISESRRGKKHSGESIKKMRESAIAAWTPERRAHQAKVLSENNHQSGVKWSEERRRASSLARTSLTEDEIRLVKQLRSEGAPYLQISEAVGGKASIHVIGDICRGEKFAWVK